MGEPVASMFKAVADAFAVDFNAAGAIVVRKGYLAMVEAGDVPSGQVCRFGQLPNQNP